MRFAAGGRVGAFEILEPLGTGGMGEVYRAHDTRLDRVVAIKLLPIDVVNAPSCEAATAGHNDALLRHG